jgi:hypothetical protein
MAVAVTVVALQRQRGEFQPLPQPAAPGTAPPGALAPAVSAPRPPAAAPAAPPPGTIPPATAPPQPHVAARAAAPPATAPRPEDGSRSLPYIGPAPAHATPRPSAVESPEPRRTGLLLVVARPWGDVRVDGMGMGTTPLDTIPLRAGVHSVVIQHPSYEPIERKVTIRAGHTARIVVDFPAQGTRKQP